LDSWDPAAPEVDEEEGVLERKVRELASAVLGEPERERR
jgi:hypothetical protein